MILTRKHVRHALVRARNERVAALGPHGHAEPSHLAMSPVTAADLRMDDDPDERWTLDFEGRELAGVPILEDPAMPRGEVRIQWT